MGLNPEPESVPHAEGVKLCDPMYTHPACSTSPLSLCLPLSFPLPWWAADEWVTSTTSESEIEVDAVDRYRHDPERYRNDVDAFDKAGRGAYRPDVNPVDQREFDRAALEYQRAKSAGERAMIDRDRGMRIKKKARSRANSDDEVSISSALPLPCTPRVATPPSLVPHPYTLSPLTHVPRRTSPWEYRFIVLPSRTLPLLRVRGH